MNDILSLFNSISLNSEISSPIDLQVGQVIDFLYIPENIYYTGKIVKMVRHLFNPTLDYRTQDSDYINLCIYKNNVQSSTKDVFIRDITNVSINKNLYKVSIEDISEIYSLSKKSIRIWYSKNNQEMLISVLKVYDVMEPYIIAFNYSTNQQQILYLSGITLL